MQILSQLFGKALLRRFEENGKKFVISEDEADLQGKVWYRLSAPHWRTLGCIQQQMVVSRNRFTEDGHE
jgi:hypothetical protein